MYFQDVILELNKFWARKGCVMVQPYDLEVGAGTFHPATFLRAIGPEPWNVAYVQPSRRPTDGRYGQNPNRLQHYYQLQVVMKASPSAFQQLYLESLAALAIFAMAVLVAVAFLQAHVQAARQLEVRSALVRALARLPHAQREALVLHVLEGLDANEISEAVGVSPPVPDYGWSGRGGQRIAGRRSSARR